MHTLSPILLDAGLDAVITDPDSPDFDTGLLTVSIVTNHVASEDVLGVRNQGTGVGEIGLSGSNITYEGLLIGSYAEQSHTVYVYVVNEGGQSVEYRVNSAGNVISKRVVN